VLKKLGLTTREHPHPYHIQWFNNNGKVKVTKIVRIHFSIWSYHDFADFDMVPMDACSLLLGRPWEFDTNAIHHGRSNKYTLMHKGKKIVLLPTTPTELLFATKSDLDELSASTGPYYALVCKHVLYSIKVASIALPPAVANLLQEYMDVFPSKVPPRITTCARN
jgi:hypothetical protein